MNKITGLYKSTSKKGEMYLSGKTNNGVKYLVFKNNKIKDNHPDYNLYIEEPENKKESTEKDFLTQFTQDNFVVDDNEDLPF